MTCWKGSSSRCLILLMSCLSFGEKEEVFFWFVEIRDMLYLEMAILFTHIKGKIIDIFQSTVFHTVWYFQNC